MNNMAVFFSGLPKAGKSITLAALYQRAVSSRKKFFLERLCPDCEGIWTSEAPHGQEMARAEKNALKARGAFFSPEFVQFKLRAIPNLVRGFPLVMFDMGGIPSDENRRFVEAALSTNAIIRAIVLHRPENDPEPWVRFWESLGITPQCILADYQPGEDWKSAADRFAQKCEAVLGI